MSRSMARASYDASVLPDGRRLGLHLPLASGMVKAADRAGAIGATAVQVFADNPTAWKRRADPTGRAPRLPRSTPRRWTSRRSPSTPRTSSTWPASTRTSPSAPRCCSRTSCGVAPTFGARFVNVHIGSHRDTSVRAGTRRLAEAVGRILGEVDDGPDAATARPRELGGQRLRVRDQRGRARRHRRGHRGSRRARAAGRASASTRPTPGAPGSTSASAEAVDAVRVGDRGAPRRPTDRHGPPQRFEGGAGLPLRPARAPRGRPDRRRRPGPDPDPPRPRPRHVLPRDARHGRGLRRHQPPARLGHRGRTAARRPAAGGADPRRRRPGADRAARSGRRAHDRRTARRPTDRRPGDRPRGPARAAGAGRGPAPARPRDAGHVGRRPGPRHARAPGVRAATASSRCSARRPRSATSTTARSTTTSSPRRRC